MAGLLTRNKVSCMLPDNGSAKWSRISLSRFQEMGPRNFDLSILHNTGDDAHGRLMAQLMI